jgi:RND family efflux transporter MFP subunit
VTVAEVPERNITEWDEFTGRLEAVDAVEIRPRVSGYIRRIAFNEGNGVKKGQVLFEIDPRPYQAELARAEAELERARTGAALAAREVTRAQQLVNAQAISREEFDTRTAAESQGDASVRAAEAAVATARLDLEWTRVRSPITGRVGRAEVTPGNLVHAGPGDATRLTTVVSIDPIYAYFEGDEQTYLKYAALARNGSRPNSRDNRSPIYLGLSNEEGFPHKGYVDFVDNQLNPEAGTIRLRAVFSNKDHLFTPGLFARIRLVGSGTYLARLVLDRAIGTDQDKKFVLVVKPDSTVDYRSVQLGRLVDGLRVVSSGLEPGEQIVINGLQRVRPGMKVAPTKAPMAVDSTVDTAAR